MHKEVKTFIEKNKNLIEEDKWEEIYKKAGPALGPVSKREFTETLLKADINPLDYMNDIPENYLYKSSIKEFKIPAHIKNIGYFAFYECSSLTSVTVPDSVKSIGYAAFYGCSGLTSITFNGTKEQWSMINKGSNWKSRYSIKTIHCKDGDIKL